MSCTALSRRALNLLTTPSRPLQNFALRSSSTVKVCAVLINVYNVSRYCPLIEMRWCHTPWFKVTEFQVLGIDYPVDGETNVTSHLLKHTDRLLHLRKHHPLQVVKQRIVENMQVCRNWLVIDSIRILSVLGAWVQTSKYFDQPKIFSGRPPSAQYLRRSIYGTTDLLCSLTTITSPL
jgi:hypothetical protein